MFVMLLDQLPEGFSRALQVEEQKFRRHNDRSSFVASVPSIVDDRRCDEQKVETSEVWQKIYYISLFCLT